MYIIYIQVLKIDNETMWVNLFLLKYLLNFPILLGLLKFLFKETCTNFYKKCTFIQVFSCNASYFLAESSERLVARCRDSSYFGQTFSSKNSSYIFYLFAEQIAKNKQTAWLLLF